MSNLKILQEGIVFTPSKQRTVAFGAMSSFGVSDCINQWLKENPGANITQMIPLRNEVLCLYEYMEVEIKNE